MIEPTLLHAQNWSLDVEPIPLDEVPSAVDESNDVEEASEPEAAPTLYMLLEGCLFASVEPLPAARFIELFPTMTEEELTEQVRQLNLLYRKQGRPYCIVKQPAGFRLVLRPRYEPVLERLHGGQKEIKLQPAAIETLSIIAYKQPITRSQIESLRGQAVDGVLRQLVRRGLISVKPTGEAKSELYSTTPKFLQLFSLRSLDDLPRAEDLDRL